MKSQTEFQIRIRNYWLLIAKPFIKTRKRLKLRKLNFENVTFELWKHSVRILKTLHPNCENVTSELETSWTK